MKPEDVKALGPMEDSPAETEPFLSVPKPYLHRMALCVAAVGLIVIGIWTTAYFFESDWAVYGSSGMVTEWNYTFGSGYTKNQYWALWSATIVAPAAVVGILLISQQVFSLALHSKAPKVTGGAAAFFFLAAGGFMVGAYFCYEEWSAKDLLDCWVFNCIHNEVSASAGQVEPGYATVVFFLALLLAALELILGSRLLAQLQRLLKGKRTLTQCDSPAGESSPWALGTLSVELEAGETPQGWIPSGLSCCPFGFARRGGAKTSEEASALSQANQADTEPDAPASRLATAMVVIWLFPFLAYMTTFIPNSWEAVTGSLIYEDIREPTKTYDANGEVESAPEVSYAVFETKTFEVATDSDETLYYRLYPDVWMYWTFIYVVVLTGLLGRASRPVRQFMAHRPAALRGHATCGGLVLLSYFSVLLIVFTYYWIHDHAWHDGEDMPANEQWARTFGQVGNLLLGLLILPVARNSMWTTVFGVSWESVLFVHIYLGYMLLVVIMCHIGCWWTTWDGVSTYSDCYSEDGSCGDIFPENIYRILGYFPTNGFSKQQMDDENMYSDNFTIVLATYITFPMFIINGVLSHHTVRRQNFELFYYSHHYFMAVYIMILWHATSAWFFVLPGLALWFWDRMIRVVRSNSVFMAARLETCAAGTVVHVEFKQLETFWGWRKGAQMGSLDRFLTSFPAEDGAEGAVVDQVDSKGSCCNFKYKMGQYVFINVPEISWLEWHPFSISSAPADDRAELHIKDMGAGTFTRALLRLAEGAERAPTILVDGPYGVPLAAYDYKRIVFVAGGIGITALNSIFRELYAAVQKKRYHTLDTGGCTWEVVKLIWVVRDMQLLEIPAFRSTLAQVLQNDVTGIFSVQVFCTNAEISPSIAGDSKTELKSIIHLGRPDLKSELARDLTSGTDSIVYACGPEGLVNSASEVALSFGVDFHKEVFAF